MCKLKSHPSYLLIFLACFSMLLPLMAQEEQEPQAPTEEIAFYGKILRADPEAEAITSLSVQELIASHQKTETPRMLVLDKEANSECWLDLEQHIGQDVKLKGTLAPSNAEGKIPMTVTKVEILFQLIGRLSNLEEETDTHLEFREEPRGFLFKSGKTFNVSNSGEYPEIKNIIDQKIAARGTIVIDESGQLAFHLWDAKVLMEIRVKVIAEKDEEGNLLRTELEDTSNQTRYLLNEDGLGQVLKTMTGREIKVSGYLENREGNERFVVVQYDEFSGETKEEEK